jgi:hypothetical protein
MHHKVIKKLFVHRTDMALHILTKFHYQLKPTDLDTQYSWVSRVTLRRMWYENDNEWWVGKDSKGGIMASLVWLLERIAELGWGKPVEIRIRYLAHTRPDSDMLDGDTD